MAFETAVALVRNPCRASYSKRSMWMCESLSLITFIIRLALGTVDTLSECYRLFHCQGCSPWASGTELYVVLET